MIVVPNTSEIVLLKYILNNVSSSDVKLKLYSNDISPNETTILEDFIEVSDASYIQKTLIGTNWNFTTVSNVSTATYSDQTFDFTLSRTVYGIYVTNNSENALLWAEKFPSPVNINAGGDIVITPTISFE